MSHQDNTKDAGAMVTIELTTEQAEVLYSLITALAGKLQYRAIKIAHRLEGARLDESYEVLSGIASAIGAGFDTHGMQDSCHVRRTLAAVRGQQLEDLEDLLSITESAVPYMDQGGIKTWEQISARTADLRLAHDTDQDPADVDV